MDFGNRSVHGNLGELLLRTCITSGEPILVARSGNPARDRAGYWGNSGETDVIAADLALPTLPRALS
jgi:hypothetical protein